MKVTRFHVGRELKKLARGKHTRVNPQTIAACVLPVFEKAVRNNDVDFLERLYRLEDPRKFGAALD